MVISLTDLGTTLLRNNGGLINILKNIYPKHKWDVEKFESHQQWGKAQWALLRVIQRLLPDNQDIKVDYHHPKMIYQGTLQLMELDIYIPSLSLAFEYQGEYHYLDHYLFGDPLEVQMRDEEKRQACKSLDITLIEVPYWWDYQRDSIVSFIQDARPDLVPILRKDFK
jgi:hypothetical protein